MKVFVASVAVPIASIYRMTPGRGGNARDRRRYRRGGRLTRLRSGLPDLMTLRFEDLRRSHQVTLDKVTFYGNDGQDFWAAP